MISDIVVLMWEFLGRFAVVAAAISLISPREHHPLPAIIPFLPLHVKASKHQLLQVIKRWVNKTVFDKCEKGKTQ